MSMFFFLFRIYFIQDTVSFLFGFVVTFKNQIRS